MNFNCQFRFFDNTGGISQGIFESLNCAENSGDETKNIELNRRIVCESFEGKNTLFTVKQIHSDKVFLLNNTEDLNKSSQIECDCVITNLQNVLLGITTADCAPILFHDSKKGIVGACHAGWRGAFSSLFVNLSTSIQDYYSSNLKNVKIWLGPMIRQKSYQVSKAFAEIWLSQDENFSRFFILQDDDYYFDLAGVIKFKLVNLGFLQKNIRDEGIDTFSNIRYFSYRREFLKNKNIGTKFGRNISVIKNI